MDIRPHWMFLIGPLVFALVFVAAAVTLDIKYPHTSIPAHWTEGIVAAVPCAWLAARFVRWRMTSLIVTNVRIIERYGVFARKGSQILLSDVVRVEGRRSHFRRLIGTGWLTIEVEGGGAYEFDDVRKPLALQRVIIRRAARLHRLPVEQQQDWPTDPGHTPNFPS